MGWVGSPLSESWGMNNPGIGFIGAGTLGKGLAMALASKGHRIAAVASRRRSSAEAAASQIRGCEPLATPQELADRCDLVFITTPDEAISQVTSQVRWRSGQGVVHCSGAESMEVLEPAARTGASTGSFHPFQTFACLGTGAEAAERLEGSTFAVEGNGWLPGYLEEMATRLGGRAIAIRPEDRAIYHASAVMSCGYLVALLKAASDIWKEMGVPHEEALSSILPMARATLANVAMAGLDASVTGPMVRGDTATLRRHVEALENRLPRLVPLYRALSRESLPLSQGRVSAETREEMRQIIEGYAGEQGRGSFE